MGRLAETIDAGLVRVDVWRRQWAEALDDSRLCSHFSALDRDFEDDAPVIPGQMTVEEALADAALPPHGGRWQDGSTDSHK